MGKTLIVGAGLSGATVARLFADSGEEVIVIDKRETIGGNAYDYVDRNGITVQPYGPHFFHTDDKEVFDFLSRFTEWEKYEHRVKAFVKGKLVPVPFNLTSLETLFPCEKAETIKNILVGEMGMGSTVPIFTLKEHDSVEIREFAEYVYQNIFYHFTQKKWGFRPEELGESVINRVPVRISYEDRYYSDEYQFMPKDGYTEMVSNMLRHPNIKLKLGKDAKKIISLSEGEIFLNGKPFDGELVYTGCIDELFDYCLGVLPYRSMKFKFRTKKRSSYQECAVINYTTSAKFTKISEFTKFACKPKGKTVIVKEYPKKFKKGRKVPYFPIPTSGNFAHYCQYLEEAKKYKKLHLLGRLATYKYIDMGDTVRNAMNLFEKLKDN